MKLTRRHLIASSALVTAVSVIPFLGVEPTRAQDVSGLMAPGPLPDMVLGNEDAPVTLVEYASMTCPHCATFHNTILPAIKEKYIETGKARLIFREFPLDPRAYAASMLARCGDQEFYFPMIDVFFKQQSNWARAEDPRPQLLQIAKLAGFTQESFEECLKNQELLDKVNQIRTKAAEEYGVDSTPSLFINGEKYSGRFSVEQVSQAIDSLL